MNKTPTTTILKTQNFAASDLAEYICDHWDESLHKGWLRNCILSWLKTNSIEVSKPKPKSKKTGRRKQLEMKL